MFRYIAILALVGSASATDVSAHARLSEMGKGLSSAMTRIKPADDIRNSGRSLLQLDTSFCGYMETQLSCGIVPSASCASTTGCAPESGECTVDGTQYDFASLLADADFLALGVMSILCDAKSANQCSADITCEFDGGFCTLNGAHFVFWLYDKCPTTTMGTAIVELLLADGITQAQAQEEADAAGYTITPEMQAEMDAQGMASSAKTLSSAFVTMVAAAALAFA
jgi:hypothetical protein